MSNINVPFVLTGLDIIAHSGRCQRLIVLTFSTPTTELSL